MSSNSPNGNSSIRRRVNQTPTGQDEFETSPLLPTNNQAQSHDTSFNLQTWKYTLLITLSVIIAFIYNSTSLEPSNITKRELNPTKGFNANLAQAHLKEITKAPHDVNSYENDKVLDYLIENVEKLKNITDRITYLLDTKSEVVDSVGSQSDNFTLYYPVSNLVARFKADNSNGKALLLSAHYDSRPLAPGATDDGVGTVVCLEILRALIASPPKYYDVMINFNNGEEAGLLGSKGFAYHPWLKDVAGFVNLEGAGAGGKALLFQSSSTAINKALIKGHHHHANVIGNDLFKLGLIQSKTDYQVYNQELNLPGVDMAFYRNRALYHTVRDTFDNTPIESINQMGNFVWQCVQNLGSGELAKEGEQPIYFDLLGRSFAFDCNKIYLSITLFILLEAALVAGYLRLTNRSFNKANVSTFAKVTLQGLKLNFADFIFSLVICFIIIKSLNAINPAVIHGSPYLVQILFLFAIPSVKLLTQHFYFNNDNSTNKNRLVSNYLATLLGYNILVGVQLYTHLKGLSALYNMLIQAYCILFGFIIFLVFNLEINTLFEYAPSLNSGSNLKQKLILTQPWASFLVNFTIGSTSVLYSGLNILLAGNQGSPTGTSTALPYIISALFGTLFYLPLSPNFVLVSDKLRKSALLGVISAVIFITLLFRFPYTYQAPLPIHFDQVLHLDQNNSPAYSTVTLGVNFKTDLILNKLPAISYDVDYRVPFKKTEFDYVRYNVTIPKLPEFTSNDLQIIKKSTNSTSPKLEILFNPEETRICDLSFSHSLQNIKIQQSKPKYRDIPQNTQKLRLFRSSSEVGWKLKFNFNGVNDKEFKVYANCYLNRDQEVYKLIDNMPDWVTFHNRQMGTLSANITYNIKL
jgi:hypothetical protein